MGSFCKLCGQKVNVTNSLLQNFFSKPQYVELEDGLYCLTCAKIKVEENRRKKK